MSITLPGGVIARFDIEMSLLVKTRSKVFPLIWVGSRICCVRLRSNTKSQKLEESDEPPDRVDQQISGRLKSPTIKHGETGFRLCVPTRRSISIVSTFYILRKV